MLKQKMVFESGDEIVAIACKQINYDIMPYYPITASTQIPENVDILKEKGGFDTELILADGEHSALGMCYGASLSKGRVLTATSGNGLLYALEQLPVQSGTRFPMVLNLACTSVSSPMSIKCDHTDVMYALNSGWLILFAKDNQEVYDFNIIGLKLAEQVNLPIIIAFDGFFTSHQKKKAHIFEDDKDVRNFIGEIERHNDILDVNKPITIGSYVNEPDMINTKYQLHLAMEKAKECLPKIFEEYSQISGRLYTNYESYMTKDADIVMYALGSTYETIKEAVERLRKDGKKVGVFTSKVLRPFTLDMEDICKDVKLLICLDRQDSYGANGGNMSLEIKASLQEKDLTTKVVTRIYGLSGKNFYPEDAIDIFNEAFLSFEGKELKRFDYYGKYEGDEKFEPTKYFEPIDAKDTMLETADVIKNDKICVELKDTNLLTAMPKRLTSGHGACAGCGLPVNINLLLSAIEGDVVLLFQTGCGSIVTTPYPKTAFKVSYVHNLLQNGASTLEGIVRMYEKRGKKDTTFVMITGDGALDIGLGSCLASGIRSSKFIIFEYDNCGYMTTGNQNSYSSFFGAKTGTSSSFGSPYMPRDMAQIFGSIDIPYVATVSETMVEDFVKKAKKGKEYSKEGLVFIKCLSACPLNWQDEPEEERDIIDKAIKSCYFPLYEIEKGITNITYNPEEKGEKIPIDDFILKVGCTKHLKEDKEKIELIQKETDRRWERLKAKDKNEYL